MHPETLLKGIAWCLSDTKYASLDEFIRAVSDYQLELECNEDWNATDTATPAAKLTVVTEEVYDENDEEVDLKFEFTSDGESFTNGELLFRLHNAFAEKMCAGYEFGDHRFFEGLNYVNGSDGRYVCYLGG